MTFPPSHLFSMRRRQAIPTREKSQGTRFCLHTQRLAGQPLIMIYLTSRQWDFVKSTTHTLPNHIWAGEIYSNRLMKRITIVKNGRRTFIIRLLPAVSGNWRTGWQALPCHNQTSLLSCGWIMYVTVFFFPRRKFNLFCFRPRKTRPASRLHKICKIASKNSLTCQAGRIKTSPFLIFAPKIPWPFTGVMVWRSSSISSQTQCLRRAWRPMLTDCWMLRLDYRYLENLWAPNMPGLIRYVS